MKRKNVDVRPYARVLREQGFKCDYVYSGSQHNHSVRCFEKTESARQLTVQLWGDGKHRVSHAAVGKHGPHSTTTPTSFFTVAEMKLAILYEWVRPSTPVRGL
jgi:hypothetical protein